MNIKPNIAFSDPAMFPSWKDRLRQIYATMTLDLLDEVLLPRRGFMFKAKYEGSLRQLNSDVHYHQIQIAADMLGYKF
jgi:hypothetical protein